MKIFDYETLFKIMRMELEEMVNDRCIRALYRVHYRTRNALLKIKTM